MSLLILLPVLGPAAAALLAARSRGRLPHALEALAALLILGSGAALVASTSGGAIHTALAGSLRVDALSAWLVLTIGAVAATALGAGAMSGATGRGRYSMLVCLFLAAMSLAVVSDNLGIVWVAVEATTIATAFLVGQRGDRRALEAAWKYVVLGSVGVALAFLGIVLLYSATEAAGSPTIAISQLAGDPPAVDPGLARTALALIVLGFATKAGLAPMHSWLPDAHSQAPARVSGLMSGVLLSVALYAILRVVGIADGMLGPGSMRPLLLAGGLLSLAVAAVMILAQRDYKRMLAYSSIEHMGIMAVGAAIGGPLATTAVLLHMLGHGLLKAVAFVVAGRLLTAVGSSRIADVHGLLSTRPELARPFLASTAGLLGFPPFPLFLTEVAIVLAGWRAGLGPAMGLLLALLLVVFAGMSRHVLAMTFGPSGPRVPLERLRERPVLAAALAGALVLSGLAAPLAEPLGRAAAVLAGAR